MPSTTVQRALIEKAAEVEAEMIIGRHKAGSPVVKMGRENEPRWTMKLVECMIARR